MASNLSDLATCIIVEAELRFGAAKADDPSRQLRAVESFLSQIPVLPFDSDATKAYAQLRLALTRVGTLIGPNDLMIASICLARGLTLVTHNAAEFARVPKLVVEDWEA